MFLSTKAYELLIASQNATVCKEAGFLYPLKLAFTSIDGGKYYKDESRIIIILFKTETRPAVMIKAFYRKDLSNFSKTDEVAIHCVNPDLSLAQIEIIDNINNAQYGCNEKRFKLACAAFHLTPDDDTNQVNLKVVAAILNAKEPADAKTATFKLENFNKDWDLVARKAMDWAQMNRLRDQPTHQYLRSLAELARLHNIKSENVFFAEATEDIPATEDTPAKKGKKAQKADRIWGTGAGIEALHNAIVMEGNTDVLHKTMSGFKRSAGDTFSPIFDGKNGLGLSIKGAFERLCGNNYECRFEDQFDAVNRIQALNGFDFLKYEPGEPQAKRSCSRDSPEPGEVCEPLISRTGSSEN